MGNGQQIPQPTLVDETTVPNKPQAFDFPEAMRRIKDGGVIRKLEWKNEDYCFMKDGWLTIFRSGKFHSWLVNDGDLDGEDWVQVK